MLDSPANPLLNWCCRSFLSTIRFVVQSDGTALAWRGIAAPTGRTCASWSCAPARSSPPWSATGNSARSRCPCRRGFLGDQQASSVNIFSLVAVRLVPRPLRLFSFALVTRSISSVGELADARWTGEQRRARWLQQAKEVCGATAGVSEGASSVSDSAAGEQQLARTRRRRGAGEAVGWQTKTRQRGMGRGHATANGGKAARPPSGS